VLAPDSEAQKMIDAANTTFEKLADLEMGFRLSFLGSSDKKKLFEAQDFFTEFVITFIYNITNNKLIFISMAIKYINKTMEAIKNRSAGSDEDHSIIEEILIRGLSPKEAIVMVVDMLMAGIDTVSST